MTDDYMSGDQDQDFQDQGNDTQTPGTSAYGGSTDTSNNIYDPQTGGDLRTYAHGGRVRGSSGRRFPLSARRMGIMSIG
jgi:hypothetical protein